MTTRCPHCDEQIQSRCDPYRDAEKMSDGCFMADWVIHNIERLYPGVFDLIADPAQWIGEREQPWFPVSPALIADRFLHVVPVIAPLPFTAQVLHEQCKHCERHHHVVHLGMNFVALMAHLNAHLMGTGLGADQLAVFIGELCKPKPDWDIVPPPDGVDRDLISAGVAWLLCHELGHFACPLPQFDLGDVELPEYARSFIIEEIKADICSYNILLHRICANGATDEHAICNLIGGISLVLRTWNLIIPRAHRRSDILAYPPRLGGATPSPTLRWNKIRDLYDVHSGLTLIEGSDYESLERHWFQEYEKRLVILWEKMYDRNISF